VFGFSDMLLVEEQTDRRVKLKSEDVNQLEEYANTPV